MLRCSIATEFPDNNPELSGPPPDRIQGPSTPVRPLRLPDVKPPCLNSPPVLCRGLFLCPGGQQGANEAQKWPRTPPGPKPTSEIAGAKKSGSGDCQLGKEVDQYCQAEPRNYAGCECQPGHTTGHRPQRSFTGHIHCRLPKIRHVVAIATFAPRREGGGEAKRNAIGRGRVAW